MEYSIQVKQNPEYWIRASPVPLKVSAAMYAYFTGNVDMMQSVVASGQLLQGYLVNDWRAFDMFAPEPWPLAYFKRQDHHQFFYQCKVHKIQKQLALMFLREPEQQYLVQNCEPYVIGLIIDYFVALSPLQKKNTRCLKYMRNTGSKRQKIQSI